MDELLANTLADTVSGPEMMANLREIARWVKLSGTPEELEAFRFLETRMRDYGYRVELLLHDAYISLPGKASVTVDGRAVPAITHSFSQPSSGLSGVPAYVGSCGEADIVGRDLRGKILLIEGMATPATAERAHRCGAVGQLHISHHDHLHEMCLSWVWGNPAERFLGEIPSTVACSVSATDGGAIRDALARGEQPVVTLTAEVDTGWRKTPLLVAELDAPSDAGGPFIMMSGHYDTWHYGVMDNGSANTGMMEAARVLAMRRGEWKRGLRICFWSGHSHGRYSGSTWYADRYRDELEARCAAHVNVDSLGGVGATELAHASAMASLRAVAAQAVNAETPVAYVGSRKARNSDESFGGIGIPSMFGAISEQPDSHARARNKLGWTRSTRSTWCATPASCCAPAGCYCRSRCCRSTTRRRWKACSPNSHRSRRRLGTGSRSQGSSRLRRQRATRRARSPPQTQMRRGSRRRMPR
ncbi:M28 family metallopeptidase [Elioraea sp.]|uniref:M28 family metallopeptidase n=1 Tax=Elioraea sp. TaxID=2185103 RepID=UPI003F6FBFD6